MESVETKSIRKFLANRKEDFTNIIVFVAIFAFLLSYFKPSLILSNTITSGGDTGSHNYPLWYLKHTLVTQGRIRGWSPGWYAGFPIFQFYFVLPFLVMLGLSYLTPLWVSFKLVTVMGVFMLPVAAFIFMKLLRAKFPAPILAALFSLPFLFMEANSMWGGNIPSTLAGEFSYSISFALTFIFLGLVYRAVKLEDGNNLDQKKRTRWAICTSICFTLIVLFHIYTAIFAAVVPLFLLLGSGTTKKFKRRFVLLFKIYILAFAFSAFWTVPLLMTMGYATPYHYVWRNLKIEDVFPKVLAPFTFFAIIGVFIGLRKGDEMIKYVSFAILASLLLYKFGPIFGLTDIRFIPIIQFLMTFVAAYLISALVCNIKLKKWPGLDSVNKLITIIILLMISMFVLWWTEVNVTYIDFWIKWNYEGFQNKQYWNQLKNIANYLQYLPEGRVVHEYSNSHDKFGTPRAFENIPLFTGKPTLEGLNIESALSAPHVFIIQAEISETQTCPIPGMQCGTFNIMAAEEHLELFNIRYIVATTDKLKNAIETNTEWPLLQSFEDIEIYEVGNTNYAAVPKYRPLMFKKQGTKWKETSIEWFKNTSYTDAPIVFVENPDATDSSRFGPLISSLDEIETNKVPIDSNCTIFDEEVEDDQIKIRTDCIGMPIIVKISYFPNWKVEGADKIYLVSPSFMIVFPQKEEVRLYYGHTIFDHIGMCVSIVGAFGVVLIFVFRKLKL